MDSNSTTIKPPDRPSVKTLQIKIGGMSCSFCSQTIKKAYQQQRA